MHARYRHRRRLTILTVCAAALFCSPASALAQRQAAKRPSSPQWTVEVVGGYAISPSTPGGGAAEFPAGTPFTTEAGLPSRTNPSWYFGDGAALFNAVAAEFESQFDVAVPRLAALDSMLRSNGRRDSSGISFGARITRRLTSRFSLEAGFERSRAEVGLTDAARTAVEAARASFESAFGGLLETVPQTGLQVTAVADLPGDVTATRTLFSGALNVSVVRSRRFAAHVTAGVGRATNSGGSFDVGLRGEYRFRFFDQHQIDQSDRVTIRFRDRDDATVGIFGGGVTYDVGARHGFRADIRVHAWNSGQTTTVEASPVVVPSVPPFALPSNTSPGIQFSNASALPSSLGGTASNLTTFAADGLEARPHLTLSYFIRF